MNFTYSFQHFTQRESAAGACVRRWIEASGPSKVIRISHTHIYVYIHIQTHMHTREHARTLPSHALKRIPSQCFLFFNHPPLRFMDLLKLILQVNNAAFKAFVPEIVSLFTSFVFPVLGNVRKTKKTEFFFFFFFFFFF